MSEIQESPINYIATYESKVRTYPHSFPEIFHHVKGSIVFSESGDEYTDFFSGVGALNYG